MKKDLFRDRTLRLLPTASLVLVLMAGRAPAADRTWDGGGDTALWANAANWAGNIVPGAGDNLFFRDTVRLGNTNNFVVGTGFNSITFSVPSGAFVLGGNSVALGGGITNNQVVTPQTIALGLSLGGTRPVEVVADGRLTLGGVIAGAGGLTKGGAGELILSGANTFGGSLAVNNGAVTISSDGNLGSVPGAATPGSIVLNNGTLHVTADFTINANRGIAVGNAGGAEGRIDTDESDSLVYGGVIAGNGGAGGLTKGGFGDITLSGGNTYTGPTAIKVGTINLDFTTGGTSDIINSASPLELGGENSDLGGQSYAAIVMNGAASEANSQTFNGTSLDIGTSRIVANSGAGGSATLNLGSLTHAPGGNVTILLPAAGAIKTTSANVNGILGGFAMVSDGTIGNGILSGTDYATVDGSGNILAYTGYTIHSSGTIASQTVPSGNFRITDSTTGDLTVAAPGTGVVDINTLNLDQGPNGRGNPNDFSIVVGAGNTLRLGAFGGISRSDAAPNTVPGGDLTWALGTSAGGANGIQNEGILTAGGANNTPGEIVFTINNRNQSSGSLNVEVQITDNGTGAVSLVKSGRGSMKLRGHNTYSGGSFIMQGRFQLAGSEIGTGNPDAMGTGPAYIFPGGQLFASGIGGAGGGPFTNQLFLAGVGTDQENTGAIRMGNGVEFAGPISLFGDATLGGGGTGANVARVTGRISGDFGLAVGALVTINSQISLSNTLNDWSGTTTFNARNTATANSVRNDASEVIPHGFGKGNVVMHGNTSSGTITWELNGFSETINGLATTANNPAGVRIQNSTGASVLTVGDNDQSGTFAGVLQDSGGTLSLVKIDGGSQTLSGANTYSGDTIIQGGTLVVAGAGSIASSANIRVNSGATLDVSQASAFSTPNPIGINGGAIVVASASGLGSINLTNARVRVQGLSTVTPNLSVSSLTLGGTTNVIDVVSVGFISGYPAQFPIIKYTGALSGAAFNFGLGEVPRPDTIGFISNNVANSSVDLVLIDGPKPLTWTGANSDDWDINTTTNWLAFGTTPIRYQNVDAVLFNDSTTVNTVDVTTTVIPSAVIISNEVQNYTFQGSGSIVGLTSLVKQGAGSLTIANDTANGFTGGVVISNGTVQVGNNGTSGALPAGSVLNEGALIFRRSDALTQNLQISGLGSVTQNGSGVTTLGGASTYEGLTTIAQGTLRAGVTGAFGVPGQFVVDPGIVINSGATLDVGGQNLTTEPVSVSGTGVGGNGAIISSGAAQLNALLTVNLTGPTAFGGTGRWDIRGTGAALNTGGNAYNLTKVGTNQISLVGVAVDAALANINVQAGILAIETTSTIGNPASTLTVASGATLQFFNNNATIFDKVLVLNGDGLANTLNNASGDNTVQSGITLNGACVFNVGGTSLTLNGALGGGGSLTKNGGNLLTLNGAASYSGNTTVNGGTLFLATSLTGGGTLSNAVGSTISGQATNSGPVSIAGTLLPGGINLSGDFGTGPLTLNAAQLTCDLGKPDQSAVVRSDRIRVTGSLTLNGVTTLNLAPGAAGALTNGQVITLIQYSGALTGTAANLALGAAPLGYSFSLVNPATTPGLIQVTVVAAPQVLAWRGGAGGNPTAWDTDTTLNWVNTLDTVTPVDFTAVDAVTFTDTQNTNRATLIGNVQPSAITANNSAVTYTLDGSGKLTGAIQMTLQGGGRFIIANTASNDFSGAVNITSGALQVGNGGANGSLGTAVVTNQSELVFNRSDSFTIINNITGGGTISNIGSGVVTLAGANTYDGGLNLIGGTLRAGSGTALGSALGSTAVENGATLDVGGQTLNTEPVTVIGAGVGGAGAIINSGAASQNAMGNVTLAGHTTFGGSGRWDIRGGLVTLSTGGNPYNLTKVGTNQFTLVGVAVDPALANINVQGGTFAAETTTSSLGNPANTLTLSAGATFQMFNSTTPFDKVFLLTGNGVANTINVSSGIGNQLVGPITLTGPCLVNITSTNALMVSSLIGGAGSLTKTSTGTLTLANTLSYAGNTTVNGGALLLTGAAEPTNSPTITLAAGTLLDVTGLNSGPTLALRSGQTLQGHGAINGALTVAVGATVAPGTSAGLLTVTNAVTLAGTALMEIHKTSNTNDRLRSVLGSITYGGTLTVTNIGGNLVGGESYKLFDASSYLGSFGTIQLPPLAPGLAWVTSALSTSGTISVAVVPIPKITSFGVIGGNVVLSGTNGPASGTYHVLTSTNVALPIASWTSIATNTFNGSGNFSYTNGAPSDPQRFYLLRVP